MEREKKKNKFEQTGVANNKSDSQNLAVEGYTITTKEVKEQRRIVDRLDLQLLVAVIVFFVSAWAYLDNTICDFTATEPRDERMSYILVHYILSLMLILCIAITHIKGKYLLKTDKDNFEPPERRYIDLFIDSWLYTLLMCVCLLILWSFIPWWLGLIIFCLSLFIYQCKHKFPVWEIILSFISIILLFPIFISVMVNISKDIEINVMYDKEIEWVSIDVDAKSYDCRYIVKGLTDEELTLDKDYEVKGPVIFIKKAYLRNNMVTISTICPASGSEFFKYPIRKIFGYDNYDYEPIQPSVYNKTKIINIQ